MSFDPNQPGDWSELDSRGRPKRRDPVLDLFATNESRELEPIEDDDDDVQTPKAEETQKPEPAVPAEDVGERSVKPDRRPAERPARRDFKTREPREREPSAAKSAKPAITTRQPAETAPVAKQPATSHWAKLAGMLGIGGKTGRDSKDPLPEAEVEPPLEIRKASAPSRPRAADRPARHEVKRKETPPSPPPPSEIEWESPALESRPVDSGTDDQPEMIEEIDPGHIRFLDGEDFVEFEIEELDPEGKLSQSKGAVSLDQPSSDDSGSSPRRGPSQIQDRNRPPARNRQRPGPKQVESEFREDSTADPATSKSGDRDLDADHDADAADRPRKRRRRRGRGKVADGTATTGHIEEDAIVARVDDDSGESDIVGRSNVEDVDVELPKRHSGSPRQARERGSNTRGRGRIRDREPDLDDETGGTEDRARKTVTTWSDAISGMIDRNMKARKGRPAGGRGNTSNKPRGNSGPRRR